MSTNPERDLDILEEMMVDSCVHMYNAWRESGGTVLPPVLSRLMSDAHACLGRRHGKAEAEGVELSRMELLVEMKKVVAELESGVVPGRRGRLSLVASSGKEAEDGK